MLLDQLIEPILALPRIAKRSIALALDAGLCVLTVWLAYFLRLGEWVPLSGTGWPAALASILIALPVFYVFGLYRAVFRYISWEAIAAIIRAVAIYGIIYSALFTAYAFPGIPRTVGIIQPILLLLALVAARGAVRYWLGGSYRRRLNRRIAKNVIIYGAGTTGRQLAAALSESLDMRLVGFIDDARDLQGSVIGGLPVFGPEKMASAVDALDVSEIFLAIPSARQARRNEILELVQALGVGVRTLPALLDIARGRVTVSQLRPLDIEDLLGRDPVAPDIQLLKKNIHGKCVLVTGSGGSIGAELCRQILKMRPVRLVMVDSSEYALYGIHRELDRLRQNADLIDVELVPLLASVCDETRLRLIFATWRPETVYHAAAYKHVPLVELNPVEGVRNNLIGTLTCACVAEEFAAENFVLISSDKAVRPTNVMGASKRLSEMVLQALAARGASTVFSMVRFGNVLGSSGSVVPLFRQQISSGGPVTVTHPEVTRYFMTIPEAAQLVLQAGAMASGGDVFVLDMGESVKIVDLARRMIELSGLTASTDDHGEGDIEIVFTGLRPGEKLYEELLIGGNPTATSHPRIMRADEDFLPYADLMDRIALIRVAIDKQDAAGARKLLSEMIPEYEPTPSLEDLVHREQMKTSEQIRLHVERIRFKAEA